MKLTTKDVAHVNPEFRIMNNRVGLFNSSMQDYKRFGIPKAQLILTDIPYSLGANAYGSNPTWYEGGDRKNGESDKAGETFFTTDENFKPAEFMHFAAQMLKQEPKENGGGKSPCMIVFCEFEQQFYLINLAKRYGLNHYINLVFRKNYSAQVLKANMRVVGNCEYGLILYRDKLPKFNNHGSMVFNCMDYPRDLGMERIHPTQKSIPLLKRLIELFTDVDDVVIDPFAGSGSTLVAAASMGRKAYGMEISKRFYVDACDALSKNIRQDLFNESIEEKKRKEYSQKTLFFNMEILFVIAFIAYILFRKGKNMHLK